MVQEKVENVSLLSDALHETYSYIIVCKII